VPQTQPPKEQYAKGAPLGPHFSLSGVSDYISQNPLCFIFYVVVAVVVVVFVIFTFFFFFFFFWFFFSELGTKSRALRFLGKRSTTELNPQPLYLLFLPMAETRVKTKKGGCESE